MQVENIDQFIEENPYYKNEEDDQIVAVSKPIDNPKNSLLLRSMTKKWVPKRAVEMSIIDEEEYKEGQEESKDGEVVLAGEMEESKEEIKLELHHQISVPAHHQNLHHGRDSFFITKNDQISSTPEFTFADPVISRLKNNSKMTSLDSQSLASIES